MYHGYLHGVPSECCLWRERRLSYSIVIRFRGEGVKCPAALGEGESQRDTGKGLGWVFAISRFNNERCRQLHTGHAGLFIARNQY